MKISKDSTIRKEFDTVFLDKVIRPDGGVIYLHKKGDDDFLKIILVSEVKRQGTNDMRVQEGKPKQAQGNAIERLAKNLTGIKTMMNHEAITPFVCFGHGCDFVQDYDETSFVMSKISMLNEFYYLNKTYVFKKDGHNNKNHFSPVSMYFREQEWTQREMFDVLKEIAETSLRYYLY
jgi:type II restriction enzyme